MKYFAIGLFCCVLSMFTKVGAQGISLGPKAGLTLSGQHNNGDYNVLKTGLEYGLFVKVPITERIGVLSEVLITQKGYKKSFNKQLFDQLTTTYLQIPILITYKIFPGKADGLVVNFGPYYGRWLSGKYASKISEDSKVINEDYEFTSIYDGDGFKDNRNELGLAIGISYSIPKSALIFDIRYCHGLMPVENWQQPNNQKAKFNYNFVCGLMLKILK